MTPRGPERTATTGAPKSNPLLPGSGGGPYAKTPAALRKGAVGAISIAVGPRTSESGDHCATHRPLASTTQAADAGPATPASIGTPSAAARTAPRTIIAPRVHRTAAWGQGHSGGHHAAGGTGA